jgi:molecular chaperone GrpE
VGRVGGMPPPPPAPPPSTFRVASAPPAPAPAPEPDDREAVRRALADLAAAEGRVEKNAKRVYDETRGNLVSDLLPVLDNLDRTIRASETAADATLLAGVRMVRSDLERVLLRFGLEPIQASGEAFDPAVHEAVMAVSVTDPKLNGRVVDEVAPGYRFGGKVLRASKVTVGVLAEARAAAANP